MTFTENLYLKRQLKQLQEENLKLKQILSEADIVERMSPAAVDAADKALGASHYVLSGGPVSDTVGAVADAISASNKKQAEKEVNRAETGNLGPRPGPKF